MQGRTGPARGGVSSFPAIPDLIGLTDLQHLTVRAAAELILETHLPDTLGRMTALEHLILDRCGRLRTLPASIVYLSRLQMLSISEVPLCAWRTCHSSRP